MKFIKLPSGKWVNLAHVMMARWSARESEPWLALELSDGSAPTFTGEDATAMAQALDNATEGYNDYSKGVIHSTSPSEVTA